MEAISYLNTQNLYNVKSTVMIELLRSHTDQFIKYKKNEGGDDITHICSKYTIVKKPKINHVYNKIMKFPILTSEHSSSSNYTYSLNLSVRTQS